MNMSISLLVRMVDQINSVSYAYGIDIVACMNEVHASNMSKLDVGGKPIYRDDGKVMKGPNYFVPNLKRVLYGETNAV
jgi:predicted HAD superfamily Cof-like phosphohydrolase